MNRTLTPYCIVPTPEAQTRLMDYFDEVTASRRAGDLADVSQYASRWSEQASRLALVLHASLYGSCAHEHPLELETAENAIRLAKWFAGQQLDILAKGRRQVAEKKEDEVLQLLDDRGKGERLDPEERKRGLIRADYVTARNIYRARICPTPEAAAALLARMEEAGILTAQDVRPEHGGKGTRLFRSVAGRNPVPE